MTLVAALAAALLAAWAAALGDTRVTAGAWGGAHVALTVTDAGAQAEFDCASGTIDRALAVDARGSFQVDGVYVAERAGPLRIGDDPSRQPARYSGTVKDDRMTLTVTLKQSGAVVGTFTLTRGARSGVRKCK